MKLSNRLLCAALLFGLILVGPTPALAAPPPLPSSFYGLVNLDGVTVPAGTPITAWISGSNVAQTAARMYEGASVYTLDVPADNPDTGVKDGGMAGDSITISVQISGQTIIRTATWQSGANVRLDLVRIKLFVPVTRRGP